MATEECVRLFSIMTPINDRLILKILIHVPTPTHSCVDLSDFFRSDFYLVEKILTKVFIRCTAGHQAMLYAPQNSYANIFLFSF